MALTRIDNPEAAPTALSDYEKQNNLLLAGQLDINEIYPVDYDNDLIPEGVTFSIGGSLYKADADEAISGTPSDFVKVTPQGDGSTALAAYVANLTGVTWNSVYNHYADGSGNLYLFDEAKALLDGDISVAVTYWANIRGLNVRGSAVIGGDFTVNGSVTVSLSSGEFKKTARGVVLSAGTGNVGWNNIKVVEAGFDSQDFVKLYVPGASVGTDYVIRLRGDKSVDFKGKVLIGTSTDNGIGELFQAQGGATILGAAGSALLYGFSFASDANNALITPVAAGVQLPNSQFKYVNATDHWECETDFVVGGSITASGGRGIAFDYESGGISAGDLYDILAPEIPFGTPRLRASGVIGISATSSTDPIIIRSIERVDANTINIKGCRLNFTSGALVDTEEVTFILTTGSSSFVIVSLSF